LPVTVSLATVQGAGFSLSGGLMPLILTSGQTATIQVVFDPVTAGAATGTLTIVSTSLANATTIVNLSGTGNASAYEVNLAWEAPVSSIVPVAGYDVFRSSDGGNTYQQMNPSLVTQTAYSDMGVQAGQTYDYMVESVDGSGVQSAPSNLANVTIP
jgi:fibronectin type 3 domain-containing protein